MAKEKAPKAPKAVKNVERKVRPVHPLVDVPGSYPFETVPPDFQFGVMKPLSKKDFTSVAGFMEYRASMLESAAGRLRQKAAMERKYGSKEERNKVKKFTAMTEKLAELQKELEASGIDPASLIAALKK